MSDLRPTDHIDGPAGRAWRYTELLTQGEGARPTWLFFCPGQSAAWDWYVMTVLDLAAIERLTGGVDRRFLSATHEVIVLAVDGQGPDAIAVDPCEPSTLSPLRPANVVEQVELPSDEAVAELERRLAVAIVSGELPAEPPLSGQVEPWRMVLIKTSAHLRWEAHAP